MDFSVDKTQKVLSEINQYQMAGLKALLVENISLTQKWYLAADAASHFLRRKKSCELLGNPTSSLIHQVATLILSAQEQRECFSNSFPKTRNEAEKTYHYWIACSQALSSSNLNHLLTHLKAIEQKCKETFPTAIPFLQEAAAYFQTIRPTEGETLLSEQQQLFYHWNLILYDAFFLASSKKATPLAEEILLARRKAIHAIEARYYQRAHTWSLMAFIKGNIFEHIENKKNKGLQKTITSFEKKLLHGKEGDAWQRGFYWLFIAVEAQRRKENLHQSENKILITAYQQTVNYTNLISKKWERLSHLEIGKKNLLLFSKFLSQYRKCLAERAERRHRSLIKVVLIPEVTFCVPSQSIPTKAQEQDIARGIIHPQLQYTVLYNWIYQTWHFLTQAGIHCQLSKEPLTEGIIVTLGKSLPPSFKEKVLSKKLFLVDVVADNEPYEDAPLHLIQNKKHAILNHNSKILDQFLYVPHWPQPYLIPRSADRRNHFENICFFGHTKNLASELQSALWQQRLQQELGLTFKVKEVQEWHDYSNVDCIVAIRDFSKGAHFNKPGTKLYNAWLAGIPFIGGSDTAYAAEGHPGKNYLIATSLEEVFEHLRHLKEDEAFRRSLIEEGKKSAVNFTQQATLEYWKKLVLETIPILAIQRHQMKIS